MSHLQVKKSLDGRVMARRTDGIPLTLEDREQARRMMEPETTGPALTVDDILNTFFTEEERHGWRYLVVQRPENYPQGPLTVGPGLRIADVAKFAERTIEDLQEGSGTSSSLSSRLSAWSSQSGNLIDSIEKSMTCWSANMKFDFSKEVPKNRSYWG